MFGFFSRRWRRAGQAVGISGGADKLAKFDADGNVVSSGIDADDVAGKLYHHYISVTVNDTTEPTYLSIEGYTYTSNKIQTFGALVNFVYKREYVHVSGPLYNDSASAYMQAWYAQASTTQAIEVFTTLLTGMTQPASIVINNSSTLSITDTVKGVV